MTKIEDHIHRLYQQAHWWRMVHEEAQSISTYMEQTEGFLWASPQTWAMNRKCALCVAVAGPKTALYEAWRRFRSLGYKTAEVPEDGEAESYTYWTKPGSQLGLTLKFTSTQCVRVQVGEELAPVYEVQCS